MKFFKTIYKLALLALFLIALLFVVSIFPISGIKVLTVLSGSMEPNIHVGSVVVVKSATDYKIGDVVTFGSNTKTQIPTTHRISEIRIQDGQKVYKTKGDANNSEDINEIQAKDIIGRVYISVPYAGYVVEFVKTPLGMVLVIVLPALFIIYDETRKIIKEIKKLKNKSDNFKENV